MWHKPISKVSISSRGKLLFAKRNKNKKHLGYKKVISLNWTNRCIDCSMPLNIGTWKLTSTLSRIMAWFPLQVTPLCMSSAAMKSRMGWWEPTWTAVLTPHVSCLKNGRSWPFPSSNLNQEFKTTLTFTEHSWQLCMTTASILVESTTLLIWSCSKKWFLQGVSQTQCTIFLTISYSHWCCLSR